VPSDYGCNCRRGFQVYPGLVLGDYDSGITLPVPIDRAPGAKQIEFRYESDPEPRWRHRVVS